MSCANHPCLKRSIRVVRELRAIRVRDPLSTPRRVNMHINARNRSLITVDRNKTCRSSNGNRKKELPILNCYCRTPSRTTSPRSIFRNFSKASLQFRTNHNLILVARYSKRNQNSARRPTSTVRPLVGRGADEQTPRTLSPEAGNGGRASARPQRLRTAFGALRWIREPFM